MEGLEFSIPEGLAFSLIFSLRYCCFVTKHETDGDTVEQIRRQGNRPTSRRSTYRRDRLRCRKIDSTARKKRCDASMPGPKAREATILCCGFHRSHSRGRS